MFSSTIFPVQFLHNHISLSSILFSWLVSPMRFCAPRGEVWTPDASTFCDIQQPCQIAFELLVKLGQHYGNLPFSMLMNLSFLHTIPWKYLHQSFAQMSAKVSCLPLVVKLHSFIHPFVHLFSQQNSCSGQNVGWHGGHSISRRPHSPGGGSGHAKGLCNPV